MVTKRKQKIIILGAGGHSSSLINLIERTNNFKIHGILDPRYKKLKKIKNYNILGNDKLLEQFKDNKIINIAIGIGSTGINKKRNHLFKKVKKLGFKIPSLIDPSAIISNNVYISEGVQIFAGSILNNNVKVGINTVINTKSIIEHDSIVGDHVFLGPRVTLCGNSTIKNNVFLGACSCILPNIIINNNTIVGAYSLVNKEYKENTKLIGIPVKSK